MVQNVKEYPIGVCKEDYFETEYELSFHNKNRNQFFHCIDNDDIYL
jgi:hypothetical protein